MTFWRRSRCGPGCGGRLLDAHLRDALRRSAAMPPAASTSRCGHARSARSWVSRSRSTSPPTGRSCRSCRSPAAGAAGCCGRSAPRSRSAARSPRRGRWCAATGVALGRRHRLDAGAPDVVEDVLRGQDQPEVWLWVRSDRDLSFFGSNCAPAGPRAGGRAHLGDLHEEVHADRPEERQARRELSMSRPRLMPARMYSTPSAGCRPARGRRVAPASRMW